MANRTAFARREQSPLHHADIDAVTTELERAGVTLDFVKPLGSRLAPSTSWTAAGESSSVLSWICSVESWNVSRTCRASRGTRGGTARRGRADRDDCVAAPPVGRHRSRRVVRSHRLISSTHPSPFRRSGWVTWSSSLRSPRPSSSGFAVRSVDSQHLAERYGDRGHLRAGHGVPSMCHGASEIGPCCSLDCWRYREVTIDRSAGSDGVEPAGEAGGPAVARSRPDEHGRLRTSANESG